mmetsp:Transcript_76748/g.197671  ORF Transcript_76748/g.197671 Transcript_76748/m.197671 type:complete len:200 (+) Transcript_76748:320-919(+)
MAPSQASAALRWSPLAGGRRRTDASKCQAAPGALPGPSPRGLAIRCARLGPRRPSGAGRWRDRRRLTAECAAAMCACTSSTAAAPCSEPARRSAAGSNRPARPDPPRPAAPPRMLHQGALCPHGGITAHRRLRPRHPRSSGRHDPASWPAAGARRWHAPPRPYHPRSRRPRRRCPAPLAVGPALRPVCRGGFSPHSGQG